MPVVDSLPQFNDECRQWDLNDEDRRTEIARHPRVVEMHGQSVNLDHNLEVLQHKPGAFPGVDRVGSSSSVGGVYRSA